MLTKMTRFNLTLIIHHISAFSFDLKHGLMGLAFLSEPCMHTVEEVGACIGTSIRDSVLLCCSLLPFDK